MADARRNARQWVTWLALVAAATAVVVLLVEGPPGSGYGWGSVAVSCVLVAVPLVALGLMVRAGDARYALATVGLAILVGVVAAVALVGNWSGQSSTDHVLDLVSTVLMLAAAVGAILVELPLLRRHTA
jgi:hypothetical protein